MVREVNYGFTLVETLVAIAVLGITLTLFTTAFLANTSLNNTVDRRAEATRIGEKILEGYRQNSNYGVLATSAPVSQSITRNGQTYVALTTFCAATRPADLMTKMPCSDTAVFIELNVSQNSKVLYSASTYYTRFGAPDAD